MFRDMLSVLKDGDSGNRVPIPVSQTIAQGVLSLVFAVLSPLWGILRLRANSLSPPGLTRSPQALHPVCPTVGAYAADATKDGSRLSDTQAESIARYDE
jgi:hypothetical protein